MTAYADRPAVSERTTEPVRDPVTGRVSRRPLPRFDTLSYGELWNRAGAIAAAWCRDRREQDRQKQHSLLPLLHAFAVPAEPEANPGAPAGRFRRAVREAAIGPDRDIPRVTKELITKYVTDLSGLGLLGAVCARPEKEA
jgi:hypothetical protein